MITSKNTATQLNYLINIGLKMRKFGDCRENPLLKPNWHESNERWESCKHFDMVKAIHCCQSLFFLLQTISIDNNASNGDKNEIGLIVDWTIKSAMWLVIKL